MTTEKDQLDKMVEDMLAELEEITAEQLATMNKMDKFRDESAAKLDAFVKGDKAD